MIGKVVEFLKGHPRLWVVLTAIGAGLVGVGAILISSLRERHAYAKVAAVDAKVQVHVNRALDAQDVISNAKDEAAIQQAQERLQAASERTKQLAQERDTILESVHANMSPDERAAAYNKRHGG